MVKQRHQAVLAAISDGSSISQVATTLGVSRQTVHSWSARYETQGLEGLIGASAYVVSSSDARAAGGRAAGARASRPYWVPRRPVFELDKRGVRPVPSESVAYRASVRAQMVDPRPRVSTRRRWGALTDGTSAKESQRHQWVVST